MFLLVSFVEGQVTGFGEVAGAAERRVLNGIS